MRDQIDSVEEIVLERLNTLWLSLDYDHVTYAQLDNHIKALGSYLRGHYIGGANKSDLFLIKLHMRSVAKSRITPTKTLGHLYSFLSDLDWIQLHPTRNHSAQELVSMIAQAKEDEKEELAMYESTREGDYRAWSRIDEDS